VAASGGEASGGAAAAPSGRSAARLWKLKRFDDVVATSHADTLRKGDEERAATD
jgi:hypothetical protein